jgi:NifB/MoaA-like Fe-S oxidoreductase
MDPVVSGSGIMSNFCDQRWCCHEVSEVVFSVVVLSAAATERVRLARNTAAAEILKPIMGTSSVGLRN